MTDSFINVPDTGPRRVRTRQRTIGGNVIDEQVISPQDMLLRSSTTVALGAGAVFTGASFSTVGYKTIAGSVIASHASAVDGFEVQQSQDGTNWDIRTRYMVSANVTLPFSVEVVAPHARIVYTNGATAQTMMRLFVNVRVI